MMMMKPDDVLKSLIEMDNSTKTNDTESLKPTVSWPCKGLVKDQKHYVHSPVPTEFGEECLYP